MSGSAEPTAIYRDNWDIDDLRYICGLANAGGGALIIMQNGKGGSGGFRRMKRPFEQIPRLIEKELGITCSSEPILEGTALCLEITVPAVEDPISYNGIYWYYDGETLLKKNRALIKEQQGSEQEIAWELRSQPQASSSDINASGYLVITSMDLDDGGSPTDSLEDVLNRRLGYLNLKRPTEKGLTNAGVLLLHNKPECFIPGASIRLALFDKEHGQIIKQDEIRGPLSHQFTEAYQLLTTEYLPKVLIADNVLRQAPPENAMKEVLRNALIHKDYESSIPVRVSVYPDKLVIQNAVTPSNKNEDAPHHLIEEASIPRNPVIANALRLAGRINGWGGSLARITHECEEIGAAAPIFEDGINQVSVTFPFIEIAGSRERPAGPSNTTDVDQQDNASTKNPSNGIEASAETQPITIQMNTAYEAPAHGINISSLNATMPKNAPFSMRSIAAANRLDLTATDEYVLRVLNTNGRATALRISNVLGVSESTVRRSFRKLKEHGLIERIGSDKAGYWRVIS